MASPLSHSSISAQTFRLPSSYHGVKMVVLKLRDKSKQNSVLGGEALWQASQLLLLKP